MRYSFSECAIGNTGQTVSVLPVPAGPCGDPPYFSISAPVMVRCRAFGCSLNSCSRSVIFSNRREAGRSELVSVSKSWSRNIQITYEQNQIALIVGLETGTVSANTVDNISQWCDNQSHRVSEILMPTSHSKFAFRLMRADTVSKFRICSLGIIRFENHLMLNNTILCVTGNNSWYSGQRSG